MRGEIRKCPICGAEIRRGKLMCLNHWRMVPREIQRAVNRTWKEYRRADYGQPAIMAFRDYRSAHDMAIEAVFHAVESKALPAREAEVTA